MCKILVLPMFKLAAYSDGTLNAVLMHAMGR